MVNVVDEPVYFQISFVVESVGEDADSLSEAASDSVPEASNKFLFFVLQDANAIINRRNARMTAIARKCRLLLFN